MNDMRKLIESIGSMKNSTITEDSEARVQDKNVVISAILRKTEMAMEKRVIETTPELEILLIMLDGSTMEDVLATFDGMGTFRNQTSLDDVWDKNGDWGEEFAGITYDDLTNYVDKKTILAYQRTQAKGISQSEFDKVVAKLREI